MHRYTSFCIIHLLLLITIVSNCSSPIFAFESPSPRQTQSRILQDINNSNDTTSAITVPDDETNDTTPTVIPAPTTPDAAPAPVPMPVSPTTHEPTKKYEPESDDEEKDEEVDNEEKKLLFVKRFVIFIFTVLGLALLLYFRDAITFFVGTVSESFSHILSILYFICSLILSLLTFRSALILINMDVRVV